MNPVINKLKNHLQQLDRSFGDPDTNDILEMIYQFYTEYNPIDNEKIQCQFLSLEHFLELLPPEDLDKVFDIICQLCSSHERLAFLEGLHVGAQLILGLIDL